MGRDRRETALAEAYKRPLMSLDLKVVYEEAVRRGLVTRYTICNYNGPPVLRIEQITAQADSAEKNSSLRMPELDGLLYAACFLRSL